MEGKAFDMASEKMRHKEIIVCLFDGDYNLGAAALINSLVKSNFKGLIDIGHRGDVPVWVNQLESAGENQFYASKDVVINFRQVDTRMHLGYYKPYFIKETFENYPDTNKVYYFDVDIVVRAPWRFFSDWLTKGLCLCLDNSFHFLHHTHPWRKQWRQLAPKGDQSFNKINYYFNSGFLGIERESMALITRWIYYTEKYIENGGDVSCFVKDDYNHLKGDQDLMNAAITISPEIEISIVGKEGMGFTFPASVMEHAVGDTKPWNNDFFTQLIKTGRKPNSADKAFFINSKYPIKVFARYIYKIKKFDLYIASVFGRILG
jgi:hypothetical protein